MHWCFLKYVLIYHICSLCVIYKIDHCITVVYSISSHITLYSYTGFEPTILATRYKRLYHSATATILLTNASNKVLSFQFIFLWSKCVDLFWSFLQWSEEDPSRCQNQLSNSRNIFLKLMYACKSEHTFFFLSLEGKKIVTNHKKYKKLILWRYKELCYQKL